jgi:Formate--tetrahydrofolate ligase
VSPNSSDSEAELALVSKLALQAGADAAVPAAHWALGGKGAVDLAQAVIAACREPNDFKLLYGDELSIKDKIETIAREMYGAGGVEYTEEAEKQIESYTQQGFGRLPICMAKTQYSFSADPNAKGAPSGRFLEIITPFPSKCSRTACCRIHLADPRGERGGGCRLYIPARRSTSLLCVARGESATDVLTVRTGYADHARTKYVCGAPVLPARLPDTA